MGSKVKIIQVIMMFPKNQGPLYNRYKWVIRALVRISELWGQIFENAPKTDQNVPLNEKCEKIG